MAAFDADNNLQVDTAEFIDGIAGRVDKVCFTHETRFRRSTLKARPRYYIRLLFFNWSRRITKQTTSECARQCGGVWMEPRPPLSAGLNKCCGGNCPTYTFCNPLRFETFNQVTQVDDQDTVSLMGEVAFLQRIVDLNYTWAVPRQDSVVAIAQSSSAAAATTTRTFTLRSEAGEVRFTAAPGTAAEAAAAVAAGNLSDTSFAKTYIPGGRQSGIRMNQKGAEKLRDELYVPYVESGQSAHGPFTPTNHNINGAPSLGMFFFFF